MFHKLFLMLFLSVFTCYSQGNRRPFYGVIIDDLGKLPRVHIINNNTNKATFSDDIGNFRTFAKINDTLKITSVGYKTKLVIVAKHHFGMGENTIHLDKEIIELDEVELKKTYLSGLLEADVRNIDSQKDFEVDEKDLKLPFAGFKRLTQSERRLYTAKTSAAGIPFDYLLNVLSGRIRKLKKIERLEKIAQDANQLENDMSITSYVINDLGIDTTKVSLFISFCQQKEEYQSSRKNKMVFIDFLLKQSILFKERNKD